MLRANKNRFFLKIFIVRHLIGLLMVGYLAFSAWNLKMPSLALGSFLIFLFYLGGAFWMGLRLQKDIERQEKRL